METITTAESCARVAEVIRHDERFSRVSHLLASEHGNVVYDEHFRGALLTDVFSITKTVVSLLIGVAVTRGDLDSLDVRIADVLPFPAGPAHSQTVRHLLTMTRGRETGGSYDLDELGLLEHSWGQHIITAPQVAPPGERFIYDNGAPHLLACLLHHLCGDRLLEYADKHLFQPLGIDEWTWATDPSGVPIGAGHLKLTPLGLARLGELVLARGATPERQVVLRTYIDSLFVPTTAGGPPESRPYSLLTWVEDADTVFAAGWAGQLMLVQRSKNIVLVTTGDPHFYYGPPPTDAMPIDWEPPLGLLRDLVLRPHEDIGG